MILYQGLLASPASWARVGRSLIEALMNSADPDPPTVWGVRTRGFGYDPAFALPKQLRIISAAEAHQLVAAGSDPVSDAGSDAVGDTAGDTAGDTVLGVGFLHPPHLPRLLGAPRINLFVWEGDRIPPQFVAPLAQIPDEVVVPSQFTRNAAILSGVPSQKIRVVPYGFDPQLLQIPPPARAATTRFLFRGNPHWRKGIGELLQAYARAFSQADDVELLIDCTYDPATSRRRFPFEIPGWSALLEEYRLQSTEAPRVTLQLGTRSDADDSTLYGSVDVVVAPSWGESFGLVVLEGAAAARPVITTDWGAPPEFLPASDDLLPYTLTSGQERALYIPVAGAQVAHPQVDALTERLRWHHHNRADSRQRGIALRESVRTRTWSRSAHQLIDRYAEVASRPPPQ